MNTRYRRWWGVGLLVVLIGLPLSAEAAWPVVDVAAIARLLTQIRTLQQQLTTAKDHLNQAKSEFQSITGGRGMERLLGGTVRNYLPADWTQLSAVLTQATTTYRSLSSDLEGAVRANAVLEGSALDRLSAVERNELNASRRSAALLQVLARQALTNTSSRFESIQQLIDAIPRATDQKGILDLQARIQAEQGMLANEQTKLTVLHQAAEAEELARRQRVREQAVAGVGRLSALPPMGL